MSRKRDTKAQKQRKPLLPLTYDELSLAAYTYTPISLTEIGVDANQAGASMPELRHMDDDELPFIEQPYTKILPSELDQVGVDTTLPKKVRKKTSTKRSAGKESPVDAVSLSTEDLASDGLSYSAETASESSLPEPFMPFELHPMDGDELPFIEQPHIPISLEELSGIFFVPEGVESPKPADGEARQADIVADDGTVTPVIPKKSSCTKRQSSHTAQNQNGADDGTKRTEQPSSGNAGRKRTHFAARIVRVECFATKRIYPSRSCARYPQAKRGKEPGGGSTRLILSRTGLRGFTVRGRAKHPDERKA